MDIKLWTKPKPKIYFTSPKSTNLKPISLQPSKATSSTKIGKVKSLKPSTISKPVDDQCARRVRKSRDDKGHKILRTPKDHNKNWQRLKIGNKAAMTTLSSRRTRLQQIYTGAKSPVF